MRRRMTFTAWTAALTVAGLLGACPSFSSANELAGAACADGSCVNGAAAGGVVGEGVVDGGIVDGGVVGDGGMYAGGYGGLHPVTCLPPDGFNPHLFYNFYVGGNCGSVPAAMYPSPMPTPPVVGHTFYTYQPLLPHEFMYAHKRVYHHHYNYNRGLTRTRVIWAW